MTDIFQEVEEDIRRERMKSLWDRFGWVVIAAAVLIVAVTAGYKGYVYFKTKAEQEAGDTFLSALDLAADGDHAGAADALATFAEDAPGGYPVLARFRAASERALGGDLQAAVAAFDALSSDQSLTARQRALARVRAGYVLLNSSDREGVVDRVSPVAAEAGPWQNAAREILGLAAYQDEDYADAKKWFDEIVADAGANQEIRSRVQLLTELITAERVADAPKADAESGGDSPPAASAASAPAPSDAATGGGAGE